jgi:hypothetical protein
LAYREAAFVVARFVSKEQEAIRTQQWQAGSFNPIPRAHHSP